MKRQIVPRVLVAGLISALVLGACAPAAAPAPAPTSAAPATAGAATAAPTAAPTARPPVSLKFGTPSPLGLSWTFEVVLFDALKAKGVNVQIVEFTSADTLLTGLLNDQIDFGVVNPPGLAAANAKNADLRFFYSGTQNEWVFVTPSTITDPKQLNGKKIAHQGTGITKALALYVGDSAGIKPEYLAGQNSIARASALLQGQIDGTPLQHAEVQDLQTKAPGKFHILIDFGKVIPGVLSSKHYVIKRAKLDKDPETFQTVTTTAIQTARSAYSATDAFAAKATPLLPSVKPDVMLEATRRSATNKIWSTDGGLDQKGFEALLDFYVKYELIKKEDVKKYEDYAYPKFVQEALRVLGR